MTSNDPATSGLPEEAENLSVHTTFQSCSDYPGKYRLFALWPLTGSSYTSHSACRADLIQVNENLR